MIDNEEIIPTIDFDKEDYKNVQNYNKEYIVNVCREISVNKNDIITLLRTQYNIEGNIEITKLNRGSSNLFEINVNGKRYILKEFNSNKPVSLVEKEIRLIKYLQNGKLQVPQYIQLMMEDIILFLMEKQ